MKLEYISQVSFTSCISNHLAEQSKEHKISSSLPLNFELVVKREEWANIDFNILQIDVYNRFGLVKMLISHGLQKL